MRERKGRKKKKLSDEMEEKDQTRKAAERIVFLLQHARACSYDLGLERPSRRELDEEKQTRLRERMGMEGREGTVPRSEKRDDH